MNGCGDVFVYLFGGGCNVWYWFVVGLVDGS